MQILNLQLERIDNYYFNSKNRWDYSNSGYCVSTILAFDNIENKHSLYRGEDCMKNCCISLREHAINVINFEKNEMWSFYHERTSKEL